MRDRSLESEEENEDKASKYFLGEGGGRLNRIIEMGSNNL